MNDYVIMPAEDYRAICNIVREKTGESDLLKSGDISKKIGEITVTEDYMRLCNKPNFPGLGVFDKEEVVLNFDYAYDATKMLYVDWGAVCYPNTTVKHLTVNFAQKLLSGHQMFCFANAYDDILERITINADLSQIPNALQMFSHLQKLKVVDGTPIDLSSATKIGAFANLCDSLEEIRFAPNSIKVDIRIDYCGKLSDASIQSIVDGLADLTGQTAQTLTLHADVGAKLTEAQKATITAKNWTLVY